MARPLYIQDVSEVLIRDKKTKEILAIGCASSTGLSISETVTPIRGGIGAPICYQIKSEKNIDLEITSNTIMAPMFDMMTGGTTEQDVTSEVQSVGYVKVADNAGTLEVTLPADLTTVNSIVLEDITGVQSDVLVTGGVAEVPVSFKAKDGDELTYYYMKTIKGSKFTLDAAKFANAVEITYRTVCYDAATESVYSDMWWVFPNVSSTGTFDLSMSAGEAVIPVLGFTAKAEQGTGVLAYKYEQVRPEFAITP